MVEYTIRGCDELPAFDDWFKMFVDGLKYIATYIIYLIVPIVLMIVSFVGIFLSLRSGNSQIGGYVFLFLVGFILDLLFYLVYVMALGNMAHNERFGAVFEFNTIFRFIKGIGWLKYFAYVLFFGVVLSIFGLFSYLALLARIFGIGGVIAGEIVSILINVYMFMVISRVQGLMYLKGYFSVTTDNEPSYNHEIEEKQDFEAS